MSCSCGGDPDADSLLPYIDLAGVVCLNEARDGSAVHALKARAPAPGAPASCGARSAAGDAPLLVFKIPFTCAVRVSALALAGGSAASSPRRARLFVNQPLLDADEAAAGAAAAAELALPADAAGAAWHALRQGRFAAVHHLTVALLDAHGGADAALDVVFLGLRGVGAGGVARAVSAVYEARAQTADHAPAAAASPAAAGGGGGVA